MTGIRPAAWLILLIVLLLGGRSHGSENTRLFLDGINRYSAGDFSGAAETFLQVADSGVINGSLYYNLGNAYLKAGNLGRAVLWYKRAQVLIPNDPDLRFNLAYARSRIRDAAEEDTRGLFRILFFWNYLLGDRTIRWTAVIFNAAWWTGLLIVLFTGRRSPRMTFAVIGVAALVFVVTAGFNAVVREAYPTAVIVADAAPVMSGPGQHTSELFVLHAGTCVRVEASRKDYVKVRFSRDKIGWVEMDRVGIV